MFTQAGAGLAVVAGVEVGPLVAWVCLKKPEVSWCPAIVSGIRYDVRVFILTADSTFVRRSSFLA